VKSASIALTTVMARGAGTKQAAFNSNTFHKWARALAAWSTRLPLNDPTKVCDAGLSILLSVYGNGAAELYHPNWILLQEMSHLYSVCECKGTGCNVGFNVTEIICIIHAHGVTLL
jgi:hypothetical protein